MASNRKKSRISRVGLLIALVSVTAVFAACSGSGDGSGTGPVIVTSGPGTNTGSGVIGGINPDSTAAGQLSATATPAGPSGTPTPTPPSRTADEEGTARLVDELSTDEFPRTSARILERDFRNDFETAKRKLDKAFVIQGDVSEAGKDAAGQPFVHFKAGLGRVNCLFEAITDAELLRFSPDGTNAVVGTIEAWDADNRILSIRDCRVVLGF